jgi:regulatory protein
MRDVVSEVLKRAGYRLVCLQDGSSLRVPTALFRQFPLRACEAVDVEEYRRKLAAHELRFALEQSARLLESRGRSVRELTDRLVRSGFSEGAAEDACRKLQEYGYLDDRRYAQELVMGLGKKYGEIRVRQELRRRGVSEDLIRETLPEEDEERQLDAAITLARKSLRGKQAEHATLYRRAYGALARRGYPPDLVRRALEVVLEEPEEGSE